MQSPNGLWAITSYFNPLRYRRRLANYRLFRSRLPTPLLTVELALDGAFELAPGDADVLIQRRCEHVLWQKERLLNVAQAALPADCHQVAWLDCDLIFARADWSQEAARLLDRFPLVQLFGSVHHLPPDAFPAASSHAAALVSQPSLAAALAAGQPAASCLERATDRHDGALAAGLAWAAPRALLDRHGLFDACIIGGGDTALACAALGCFEKVVELHAMNAWQRAWYRTWAEPFFRSVGGRVSFVAGDVYHLWHGALGNRQPRQRHEGLRPFRFEPAEDIAVDRQAGCWRWNTDKPELHEYVREYFAVRKEDG